jgi:transglutaminase-like cysteine proteinase BTLCP
MPAVSRFGSLRRLLSPWLRLAERLVGRESVWERVTIPVPPGVFGPGSHHPFAEYFEGASSVSVRSIDDIVGWLQTCEYVTDQELFHERDVWQHPATFEQLRRGDCEDFALWAWRKLAELGIDAELFVGRVREDDSSTIDRQHAWVVYRIDGCAFLFEPAARVPSSIIRPLEDAMDEYVPHFAVNHRLATNAFVGCMSGDSAGRETGSSRRGTTPRLSQQLT